jgi:hypothetical protein
MYCWPSIMLKLGWISCYFLIRNCRIFKCETYFYKKGFISESGTWYRREIKQFNGVRKSIMYSFFIKS